jgi:hypothetical protein
VAQFGLEPSGQHDGQDIETDQQRPQRGLLDQRSRQSREAAALAMVDSFLRAGAGIGTGLHLDHDERAAAGRKHDEVSLVVPDAEVAGELGVAEVGKVTSGERLTARAELLPRTRTPLRAKRIDRPPELVHGSPVQLVHHARLGKFRGKIAQVALAELAQPRAT